MFTSIKRFFAPSFAFSWVEIKETIWEAVALSRQTFWKYARLFWGLWLVGIGVTAFFLKVAKDGNAVDLSEMTTSWVMDHGVLGAVSLLVFLAAAMFAYLAVFLIVRSAEDEHIGFSQLWQQIRSHNQLFLVSPLIFMVYSLASFVGDFYVFIFLETEGSWTSFRSSLWRGIKLGIRLVPLRFFTLLLATLYMFLWLSGVILLAGGVLLLAKVSVVLAWCAGVPLVLAVVVGLLWSVPRGLFFSFAMQSVLYDKIKARFPELVEQPRI